MRIPYEQWKRMVDLLIARQLGGLDSEGLPDYDYQAAYARGKAPSDVARAAINAAKGY